MRRGTALWSGENRPPAAAWSGPAASITFDREGVRRCLLRTQEPCHVLRVDGRVGVSSEGEVEPLRAGPPPAVALFASLPPVPAESLGSPDFRRRFGVRLAYAAGAMANGIATETLVAALGRAGLLGSFGSAGLPLPRIEAAIHRLRDALPLGPWCFNLIHHPDRPAVEQATIDRYLELGVRTIEASAFMDLQPSVVCFRAAGLSADAAGRPVIGNRVIAKLSRREVAEAFLSPPPAEMLRELAAAGRITAAQAALAAELPVADCITVEADSGGHTDNQPLVCLLPSMLALRDRIEERYGYPEPLLVGAAGGIGTPAAAAAAFTMGADYVVTGSINQACVEAGTSPQVKALLAGAGMSDVMMAPAADMFELGVQVQVLKHGTLFPMRARKLYEVYRQYGSIEEIPAAERDRLERQIFRKSLDEVWEETRAWLAHNDPGALARASIDPKRRLAYTCRWYLGKSSDWANTGEPERVPDYQVWCGPALGAFNTWVAGSPLADPGQRRVVDVAETLMWGAAYLLRVERLRLEGIGLDAGLGEFRPWSAGAAQPAPQPAAPVAASAPAPAGPAPTRPDRREIEAWLIDQIATQSGVAREAIDPKLAFEGLGIDSARAMIVLARLERWLGLRLSPTLIWNYPNIEALAERLADSPQP